MNIFYLDHDPMKAARYHCDAHVIKMIVESVQIMSTVVFVRGGVDSIYRPTHVNHPCTKWANEAYANWMWLLRLAVSLECEWRWRWRHPEDHQHTSMRKLRDGLGDRNVLTMSDDPSWQRHETTPPALAMNQDCKSDDPVASYRDYYRRYKAHIHQWTRREKPEWL